MSSSSPRSPPEASDITCIVPEPFEPVPLIADILRTGYCVPGSVFLVEGIDSVHTSRSRRWRAVRLLLGDGELCIQALLSAEMHRYVDQGEVAFGSYIRLERFRVEWQGTSNGTRESSSAAKGKERECNELGDHGDHGGEKKIVYLVVEDLVLVGWNNTLVDAMDVEITQPSTEIQEDQAKAQAQPQAQPPKTTEPLLTTHGTQSFDSGIGLPREVDADDDFEVMPNVAAKATQNRLDLAAKSRVQPTANTALSTSHLPWSSTNLDKPLKLTKLRAIPNLPYKQNWSVNVLAIVSALSAIEPSGLPPYTQRQVRLADPSTDKHVLLTVFLDPDRFAPAVGSVVLLLGVKNHRFDGGSLKKYASDRPPVGQDWWYENPTQLEWCDTQGLKRWWVEGQSG